MCPSSSLLMCLPLLVAAEAPAVKYHTDLDAARSEARKLNRPLFVVFRCEH